MTPKKKFLKTLILIIVELIILIGINVLGYTAIPRLITDGLSQDTVIHTLNDQEYEDMNQYTGTIVHMEKCEYSDITNKGIENKDNFSEVKNTPVGAGTLATVKIRIKGLFGTKEFIADETTYHYENTFENLVIGQKITVAYDHANFKDGYEFVSAIKYLSNTSLTISLFLLAADIKNIYILSVLIPSIAVFAFTVVYCFAKAMSNENNRKTAIALKIFSVIIIIGSILFGTGSYYLSILDLINKNSTFHAPNGITDNITLPDSTPVLAPVIYLYDDSNEPVNVQLDLRGDLTYTFPEYQEDGWTVIASPDGTLTDLDGNEYAFLYWDADLQLEYDFSKGFCVKGSDMEAFFDDVLPKLGLNEREASDFKTFWLKSMEKNEYNVISFQTKTYTDAAELITSTEPDVLIRVNMLWYGTDEYVEIDAQDLEGMNPSREGADGLVVVEWGGEFIQKP